MWYVLEACQKTHKNMHPTIVFVCFGCVGTFIWYIY